MRSMVRLFALFVIVAVASSFMGARASAHEGRLVGNGQYEMIVGFLDEPAFVGEKNGLQLYVSKLASMATPEAGDATPIADDEVFDRPVEGLEATLQVEILYGDQRLALPLDPVYGAPGEYASYFFPMAEGDYGFHIFGTIEGMAIDETFTSSADGFSSVQPRIEFPATAPTTDTAGRPVGPAALVLAGLAVGGVAYARRRREA